MNSSIQSSMESITNVTNVDDDVSIEECGAVM